LWVAFDADGPASPFGRDIYVMRPDGSQLNLLVNDMSNDQEPAFSPDGRLLAFASDRVTLTMQIHLLDLATRNVTVVTHDGDGAHGPAFSPDGSRIAFRSGPSVFTIALDGSDERRVANLMDSIATPFGRPTYTPDGQWILYDIYNGIRAVHPDGTGDHVIMTPTTTEQSNPAVSPDGSSIALQTQCIDGGSSIWVVPATGGDQAACVSGRRISRAEWPSSQHAAWAPRSIPGNLVAWDAGDVQHQIVVGSGDASESGAALPGPTDARNPAWTPLGTKLP
jgi:Tol biopolymer transport system component